MTRINTNVSSLVAQNRLQASNNDLNTSLTRLSTGLRINSGADDPAGLIASESLRSEITSLNAAIGNTERASQIISTADSALGEVSNLLNDIRGLVVEAGNSGGLSAEEIAANQLQVDSSLEAINRISQTTTFQGRNLLDGSLSFQTTAGTNFANITDLSIQQANLGSSGSIGVEVNVTAAASQASLSLDIPEATTPAAATGAIELTGDNPAVAGTGSVVLSDGTDSATIELTTAGGENANVTVATNGSTGTGVVVGGDLSGGITLTFASDADVTVAAVVTALDGVTGVSASSTGDLTQFTVGDGDTVTGNNIAGGSAAATDQTVTIDLTAAATGDAVNDATISFNTVDGTTTPTAAINDDGNLVITIDDNSDVAIADIVSAINTEGTFTAEVDTDDNDLLAFNASDDTSPAPSFTAFSGGAGNGGLAQDVVFELQGADGSEVFNVGAGTSISDLVTQINLVSDATGVEAAASGQTLNLTSTDFGSDSLIDLRVVSEDSGGTFTSEVGAGTRATGSDVQANINGVSASGQGNSLSINTSTLDLSLTITEGSTADISFTIDGGGALFQLGAEVVGNQQARIGIDSVNTARLGGPSGQLFQLGSGGSASLDSDPTAAAQIIDEAIGQITGLRGRLGAFQATTLESNLVSLNETRSNLQDAESTIRDADFAQESANLTRSQILVQSGTNVLALANQNPQNVLALLG